MNSYSNPNNEVGQWIDWLLTVANFYFSIGVGWYVFEHWFFRFISSSEITIAAYLILVMAFGALVFEVTRPLFLLGGHFVKLHSRWIN